MSPSRHDTSHRLAFFSREKSSEPNTLHFFPTSLHILASLPPSPLRHHHPYLLHPPFKMSAPYKPTPAEEAQSASSSYLSSSSPTRPSRQDPNNPSQPEDFIQVMSGKTPSKYTDPCAHAAKLSMKCLDDNAYDRTKCADAFNQYRECKKAWINQRRQDRLNGRPGAFD